jgi:hypothetical protein
MAVKGKDGYLIPRGKSKFIQPLLVGDLVMIDSGINKGKLMKIATILECELRAEKPVHK